MFDPIPLPQLPCTACPQHETALFNGIPALSPPANPPHPPLLILLPAPSTDSRSGTILHSRTFNLVSTAYLTTLPPVRPFFIPILRCAVTQPSKVKPAHTKTCTVTHLLPTLTTILSSLPSSLPVPILCIGAPAVRSIHTLLRSPCSQSEAFSSQGSLFPLPTTSHTLQRFATLDPAEILLRPERKSTAFAHLTLLASHLSGSPPLISTPHIVPPGPPPPTQGVTHATYRPVS